MPKIEMKTSDIYLKKLFKGVVALFIWGEEQDYIYSRTQLYFLTWDHCIYFV